LPPGAERHIRVPHAGGRAIGKKTGPEDDRTEGQRFHDALRLACGSLPRVCLLLGRAASAPAGGFRPSCSPGRVARPFRLPFSA